NPEVPQQLSTLIMQLLAKSPAQRPTSADVVVERLRDIESASAPVVSVVPLSAPPSGPAPTYAAPAFTLYERVPPYLIGGLVGLMVAGLVAAGWFLMTPQLRADEKKLIAEKERADRAEHRADSAEQRADTAETKLKAETSKVLTAEGKGQAEKKRADRAE